VSSGQKIRRGFRTLAEARSWRADAESGVRRGFLRAVEPVTINDAAVDLLARMRAGSVRTRSGDHYKPSTISSYDLALRVHILDALGPMRLSDVQRRHVQRLADDLVGDGAAPSSVRNAIMPLRVIYRVALRDGLVTVDPCERLELPAVRSSRVTIVSPEHAAKLVAALDDKRDRAVWATALYAGLRRGELLALRWRDIGLPAGGVIHVERAYDVQERVYVDPKSQAGRRPVPIANVLRDVLLDLRFSLPDTLDPDALAFGDNGEPCAYQPLLNRTRAAWKKAELEPVGLHAARHTAASLMIAANVNVKALSEFMGHSSITITLDRYGHLLPGSLSEAATLLDAFLARTGAPTGAPA
jgi:integrase